MKAKIHSAFVPVFLSDARTSGYFYAMLVPPYAYHSPRQNALGFGRSFVGMSLSICSLSMVTEKGMGCSRLSVVSSSASVIVGFPIRIHPQLVCLGKLDRGFVFPGGP
jgi:hypothetical protein